MASKNTNTKAKTEEKPKDEPKGGALATQKQATDVVTGKVLPAHLQKYAGKGAVGLSNLDNDDMEIPRLKLLQALSAEVTAGKGKPGQFFHTVSEQVFDADQLTITPIFVWKSYILWKPRHQGGGILARAMDGKHWAPAVGQWDVQPIKDVPSIKATWKVAETVEASGLAEWGSSNPSDSNSQPAATKMINLLVYIHEFPHLSPCVITLQRSANKVAKKLTGKFKLSNLPTYAQQLVMKSITERNSNNQEFFNYSFEANGLVEDAEQFEAFEAMYNNFSKSGVNIKDLEGLQGEEPEQASGAGPVDERV